MKQVKFAIYNFLFKEFTLFIELLLCVFFYPTSNTHLTAGLRLNDTVAGAFKPNTGRR